MTYKRILETIKPTEMRNALKHWPEITIRPTNIAASNSLATEFAIEGPNKAKFRAMIDETVQLFDISVD